MSVVELETDEVQRGMRELERNLEISPFSDQYLLARALTHSCYTKSSDWPSFEALEFHGDRVLSTNISTKILRSGKPWEIGYISARVSVLSCNAAYAYCAMRMDLQRIAQITDAKERYEMGPAIGKHYQLADVFEALVGALDLDQGQVAVEAFLKKWYWPHEDVLIVLYLSKVLSDRRRNHTENLKSRKNGISATKTLNPR